MPAAVHVRASISAYVCAQRSCLGVYARPPAPLQCGTLGAAQPLGIGVFGRSIFGPVQAELCALTAWRSAALWIPMAVGSRSSTVLLYWGRMDFETINGCGVSFADRLTVDKPNLESPFEDLNTWQHFPELTTRQCTPLQCESTRDAYPFLRASRDEPRPGSHNAVYQPRIFWETLVPVTGVAPALRNDDILHNHRHVHTSCVASESYRRARESA